MSRNDYLTDEASVVSEIRTSLGASAIDVELSDDDIKKALKDALRVYNRYRPGHSYARLDAQQNRQKYEIQHPGLTGVVSLEYVDDRYSSDDIESNPFLLDRHVSQTPYGGTWGDYAQRRIAHKTNQRIASAEVEWRGHWIDDKYFIFLDLDYTPSNISYRYTFKYGQDPQGNEAVHMKLIPEDDAQWVFDYTLARAKEILGRIRGKFGGIMNPDGGTDQTDSKELLQEGQKERKELEEWIQRKQRPLAPVRE